MYGVDPAETVKRVDFFGVKFHSGLAAFDVRPDIAVSALNDVGRPRFFERRPPARLENFVEIGANANVGIFRNEFQRLVPRDVEPPRLDYGLLHAHARGG